MGSGRLFFDVLLKNPMQVVAIIMVSVVAAITYGVIHDQITARICVEYFTIGHPRLIESDSPTVLGLFWGVVIRVNLRA